MHAPSTSIRQWTISTATQSLLYYEPIEDDLVVCMPLQQKISRNIVCVAQHLKRWWVEFASVKKRWQVTWDSRGQWPAAVDPGGGAPSQPPAKGAEAGGACSQPLEQEAAAQHRSLAGPSMRVGKWATAPGPQKNMGPPPAHPFIFYVLICIAQYPVDKF